MKYVYAHHSHFKGIGSDFRFLFEFLNEIPPDIQKARLETSHLGLYCSPKVQFACAKNTRV